jgi:hypothetical protein
MEHPSKEWQNVDVHPTELKAERREDLPKHIHFKGLNGEYDYMSCFFWEYHRTVAFLGIDYGEKYSNRENFFPFTEDSFPGTPYLSHPIETRKTWFKKQGDGQYNYEEELLVPFGAIDQEIEIDGRKLVFPIVKIPLALHVNPNWGLEKFVQLVRDQWTSINKELKGEVKRLKAKGHVVAESKSSRPIVLWKKYLKLLGCYRLYQCVGLDWANTRDEFGLDKKANEDRFRSDCKNNLKPLPIS